MFILAQLRHFDGFHDIWWIDSGGSTRIQRPVEGWRGCSMQGIFVRNNELYVHGNNWMFVYGRSEHPDDFHEMLTCDGIRKIASKREFGAGWSMRLCTCSMIIDNDTYVFAGRKYCEGEVVIETVKFTGDKWTRSTRLAQLSPGSNSFLDGGKLVGLSEDHANITMEHECGSRVMFRKQPFHDFNFCDVRNGNILACLFYNGQFTHICILHEGQIIWKYKPSGFLKRMVFVSDCVIMVITGSDDDGTSIIMMINVADDTVYYVDSSDLRY